MESSPAAAPRPGRRRRWLRWGGLALAVPLAAEVLYLLAANVFLATGLADRALDRRPEKLLVTYDSAWSPWPGELRVRGLAIRVQSHREQWLATAERASGQISLPALLGKRFEVSGLEARSVAFRLRLRADRPLPPGETPETTPGAPPIPGLDNPPHPAPEEVYRPPRPARRHWRVTVTGLDLEEVSEIWIERYRLEGTMAAAGGFDLRLREATRILPSRLALDGARLTLGGRPALREAQGELRLSSEPFDPTEHHGWASLPFLRVDAALEARVAGLGFLDEYLGPRSGVRFSEGSGSLHLEARLRDGRLAPGSRVSVASPAVAVGFLDYSARGQGEVSVQAGEHHARLAARLDSYRLTRDGYDRAHVRGHDLRMTVGGLGVGLPTSLEDATVAIEIPPAQVPDLTFYNAYLPAAAGLEIEAGSGTVEGHFEARPAAGTGKGRVTLSTEGLRARLRDARLSGHLEVAAELPAADLGARSFRLDGTRVTVTGARVLGASGSKPWAGRVTLRRGLLSPGRPVLLRADAAGTITDVRPLLALALAGRVLPGWVVDALGIDDVQARAEVEAGERVRLKNLLARADDLRLAGDLDLGGGEKRGRLLLSYKGFDLGLDLRGRATALKLFGAREWFAKGR